jgi:multimeric flavodoxin WrbA
MKILAIVGSPRKGGNTQILVSRIAEGAKAGGAEVHTLFLRNLNIKECDGCHRCWRGKECSKNDDMRDVYRKIIENDAIIFGTPVYWYGPTGLMKLFIDRFVYFNCPENRTGIKGKRAIIAVPFEEENPETVRLVEEFFAKSLEYLQMRIVGKIVVGGVGKKGAILDKKQQLQEAYELGRKLAVQ